MSTPDTLQDPLLDFLAATAQNLTEQARQGRLRQTYGRDAEVEMLLGRLARVEADRPLLVGAPRVGKTAIIHTAVCRMAAGTCPPALVGVTVYALAPSQLTLDLGAEWRNQVQGFLRDIAARPEILIYWRDLPSPKPTPPYGQKGKDEPEFLPMLVEHLQGSNLRCLAETRPHTLRRITAVLPETDEVFTTLRIEEPPTEQVDEIVRQVADDLEIEHGVAIDAAAREAAVSLTRRFNVAQAFPGKAIALLEEAAIQVAQADGTAVGGPVADGPVADGPVDGSRTVTAPLVAAHFSERTGLTLQITDESMPFDEAEVRRGLAEQVIGQEQAIETLVQTLSLLKARINDPDRPLGVFLFLGPTGVGKTELSKALSDWLFGEASRLVRFNMSDYDGPYDYLRLFGDRDPDEDLQTRRGRITTLLAEEPFAVLLLDEFEKAHGNIFLRFMQLFDEGILINGDGEAVNLRNTIIIATSNFGAVGPIHLGFGTPPSPEEAQAEIERDIERALERGFTPEFINRLDSVCFFKPLSKQGLHRIARREVASLFRREGIDRRGLAIEMDDEVVEHVVERGYSPKFGARHLKRQIERTIAYPLSRAILSQPTRPGDLIRLYVHAGRVQAAVLQEEAEPATRAVEAVALPEDPRRRFTLAELRAALPEIEARVARVAAFHDIETVRAEARDRMAAMSAPTFWNDPNQAEADLAALGELTRTVDLCDGLARAAADMATALALIEQRGDRTMMGEAARQYRYLLAELPIAELDLLLVEPWDRLDALLLIRATPGESHSGQWAENLANAYLAWAGRRGFEAAVIDETHDPAGDLVSLAAVIRGHGAYGLLKGETGAHRWLQHRTDGGREVAHARVEVAADLDPATDPAAGEIHVTTQPMSGRGKHFGRLRSQATATHLPSETCLTLTNDLAADANRALAQRVLAALVAAHAARRAEPAPDAESPWGAVIRNYCTYKSQYVRDLRTGVTETNVRRVLDGQMDGFFEAFLRGAVASA
jgi:ATP-dependent Clp protease ATP-binding subunit ClpC